jgi:NDP-sugar pyrophosphorylase family protein
MILAAGFGTRLWPLTEDRTKPAIPLLGRPLITYVVEYLAAHGIRQIIVNLHHKPDSIRGALKDGSQFGVNICYSYEEQILGTSGALDRVRHLLSGDDFVVINGKIITQIDLRAVISFHRSRGALATLVLRPNRARERFTIVELDSGGRILGFDGLPKPESAAEPLMFTGIQVLSPRIFEYIPRDSFSHSTVHVYPRAIASGEAVLGYVSEEEWHEVSTLARYLEVSLLLMRQRGLSFVAGRGSIIEEGALVQDSVLWEGVRIERSARVRESVLADGVRIPAGSQIERSVVVRRDSVQKIERGQVIGENLFVPI